MARNPKQEQQLQLAWYARPGLGSFLSVASGLWFLALCMLLPLVGKAGVETPFARQNYFVFLGFLLLNLVLCGLAVGSKMTRRSRDGSPPPRYTIGLAGICGLLLLALLTNLLAV